MAVWSSLTLVRAIRRPPSQELVISPKPTADLYSLVKDLLPSIGRYVSRLVICGWEIDEYAGDDFVETDDQKAEIVVVENFALVLPDQAAETDEPGSPGLSWATRLDRVRNALVAAAVSACQSARSIRIEGVPEVPDPSYLGCSDDDDGHFADLFEPTIAELGSRFTEAHISMAHQSGWGDTWDAARYIDYFRSAKAMTIEFNGIDEHEQVSDELYEYLGELEDLESLRLICVDWLQLGSGDEDDLPPNLKHLQLEDMVLTSEELHYLGGCAPESLEALTLVSVECHTDASQRSRPFDFHHLRRLSLATPTPPSLLGLFRNSPLERVELCATRYDPQPSITPDRVVRFAQRHAHTLKSLLVHDTVIGGMHKARLIENWGARQGALVTVCPAPILPALEVGSDATDDEAWTDDEA